MLAFPYTIRKPFFKSFFFFLNHSLERQQYIWQGKQIRFIKLISNIPRRLGSSIFYWDVRYTFGHTFVTALIVHGGHQWSKILLKTSLKALSGATILQTSVKPIDNLSEYGLSSDNTSVSIVFSL